MEWQRRTGVLQSTSAGCSADTRWSLGARARFRTEPKLRQEHQKPFTRRQQSLSLPSYGGAFCVRSAPVRHIRAVCKAWPSWTHTKQRDLCRFSTAARCSLRSTPNVVTVGWAGTNSPTSSGSSRRISTHSDQIIRSAEGRSRDCKRAGQPPASTRFSCCAGSAGHRRISCPVRLSPWAMLGCRERELTADFAGT